MTSPTRADFDQFMTPNYAPAAVVPVRGAGSRLWDQDEREYVDFAGGIAVSSVGHAHPALVAALTEQAGKLWHLSNVMTNEPALALARRLTELTFAERVYFCNSGGEANEAALKLARRHAFDHSGPQRNEIVSTLGSFHGRTLFTVTVGGQPKYTEGFGPLPGGIRHVAYDDLAAMEAAISERTAAVIVEPLQGEGGVRSPGPDYLAGLRRLCDERGALLIFDEVQTGAGRTGSLYAYQQAGVAPDILTTAKGLAGGFPIGAMLTTATVAASLVVGTHGSTFGGNPLGCAVALAALDIISDPQVLSGVGERHRWLREGLETLNERHGLFREVRGQGLLLGCELRPEFAGRARELLGAATDAGVLCLVAGPDVLRLAPSLIISRADVDEGLARLDQAMAAFKPA